MADVAEIAPPPAVDQLGNLTIWWVPTIADTAAVKVATELGAATSFRVTYSFISGGFPVTSSQESTPDERLSLLEVLESLGKITTTFGDGLEYVDSSTANSAAVVLKPVAPATSKSGYFVVRPNIAQGTLAVVAQKGTVYPVTLGQQRRGDIADATGKFRFKQKVVLTSPPVETVFAA